MNPAQALPSRFLKIHSNTIFPSSPSSYNWSPIFSLFRQNPGCICLLRVTCRLHVTLLDPFIPYLEVLALLYCYAHCVTTQKSEDLAYTMKEA